MCELLFRDVWPRMSEDEQGVVRDFMATMRVSESHALRQHLCCDAFEVTLDSATDEQTPFSENRVWEGFRRVRNRLQKHYPEQVIFACIEQLNERPPDRIQHWRFYPPWRLLLLIKWASAYGDYISPGRRPLTPKDFNYLVNLMHDLEGMQRPPARFEDLFLFFRKMAFQQFWLQSELNPSAFGRQSLLFNHLVETHSLKKWFRERHSLTVTQFIDLASILIAACVAGQARSVTVDSLHAMCGKHDKTVIRRFLDLLSVDFDQLRTSLLAPQARAYTVSREMYENTPLRRTPLLRYRNTYYPFYPTLLSRSLETLAYDTLRDRDAQQFMDKFAPVFEKYVGASVSRIGLPILTEQELKATTGRGKVVDYVITSGSARVLLDAKGVEMAYLGMVDDDPEIVRDKTKASIFKGIEQGFDTVTSLNRVHPQTGDSEDYLIVVTFKDLLIGNGKLFHESVATEKLDELVSRYGGHAPIPFEHMYFMSIDDFDVMASAIAAGCINLTAMLRHAVEVDSKYQTAKFVFGQHIYDVCPSLKTPDWLSTEFRNVLDRCRPTN